MTTVSGNSQHRTAGGIVLHVLGLLFGLLAVAPAYVLFSADFSKDNARNALNWQLFFFVAIVLLLVILFAVPVDLVGVIAGFLILALYFVDFGSCLYASYRASRGDTWRYPFAPNLV